MNAEIVSVGTELLLGQIANTDAQFLSKELSALGINMYYHHTVGDNPGRLRQVIRLALGRSDLIITTGGIGPTLDDLTKETVAEELGLEMVEDKASVQQMKDMFRQIGRREITENNFRQCWFPKGSTVLPNRRGTAPGCAIEHNGKTVIILPGPPSELQDMYKQQVLPYLQKKTGEVIHSKVLRIFGVGESKLETELMDLFREQTNPTIASYAGNGEVTLRLTTKLPLGEDPEPVFAPMEKIIYERLGDAIYGTGEKTLPAVVLDMLKERGKTLAVAESCTGGMIAASIVDNPGASVCFMEGIVTYSNESKMKRLGVKAETLEKYGAVSVQTAKEMAAGARITAGTDYAVSTTGVAGPGGGTAEKPVGLVCIGVADENGAEAYEFNLGTRRDRIRMMACLNALNLLRKKLLK